ncbi:MULTISPECIES: hypothetical protein [Corallincola]|uniref:DUF4124 domain-containing protein n=3 Tax=Corallincola TaxID=1775176 RepID=A0A368N806_9GAMM|nr:MULTISPECIES: hypothetical protein [Corallincola]RCU45399.1 hypothetical protein DU002_15165 [Corallincola holothuriorum]TAA41092.1 hypothetical protein EXY25_17480 [Corallincola spongiicola]TCI02743.1 hypothetical protein EZV61_13180 [Corallincola luteus]
MAIKWYALIIAVASVSFCVQAKVYRCTGDYGDEYRDMPCNEHQENRESAEYKVGSGVVNKLSLRTLAGVWCNYAKSHSIGGVRDYTDPDRWSLSMTGQLEIQDLDQFDDNATTKFQFKGRNLQVDNELGRLSVAEYLGDEMVLLGQQNYLFMRRGGCTDIPDQDVAVKVVPKSERVN